MAERIYDRDYLIEYAERVIFPQQPNLLRLLATSDGQFFAESARNDAANYARETRQELVVIEKLQEYQLHPAVADDPLARDVAAVMLALNCTDDHAQELITHYKGNTEMLVKEQRAIRAAVEQNTIQEAPADGVQKTPLPAVVGGTINILTEAAPAKPRRSRKPKPTDEPS